MADKFLEAASLGSRIANQGFEQYWKQKEFQEQLAERAQRRTDTQMMARQEQANKEFEQNFQLRREGFEEQAKKLEIENQAKREENEARRYAEMERHNRAMEGRQTAGISGLERQKLGSALSRLKEIDAMGIKGVDLTPSLKSEREQLRQFVSKEIPGMSYSADKPQPPSWLRQHLPEWMGGVPSTGTQEDTGSLLDKYGAP